MACRYLQQPAQQPQQAAQSAHEQPSAQQALAQHCVPQQADEGQQDVATAGDAWAADSMDVANRTDMNFNMRMLQIAHGKNAGE